MKVKSKIITGLVIAVVVALTIFCAGCTDNQSSGSTSTITTSTTTQTVAEDESFKEYVGDWSTTESDGKTVKIHIEKDGTGYVETSKDNIKVKVTMKCYDNEGKILMYGTNMQKTVNGKTTESILNTELGRFTKNGNQLSVVTDGETQIFTK